MVIRLDRVPLKMIVSDPSKGLKLPQIAKREMQVLSVEQAKAFLKAALSALTALFSLLQSAVADRIRSAWSAIRTGSFAPRLGCGWCLRSVALLCLRQAIASYYNTGISGSTR